jgi:hypothetical protein
MTAFIEDKSTILGAMIRFLAVAGVIAFVPSVYAAAREGLWLIVGVDALAYALVIFAAFSNKASFSLRLILLVSLSLIIGMVVLYQTGPFGAGYIWMLSAAVLSALFGKTRIVVLVNGISMLFMMLWGLGISLAWVDSRGARPVTVVIIASNLLLISAGLSIVIRSLMDKLSYRLGQRDLVGQRLASELEESTRMARQLDATLHEKDAMLRELHHRVKNNLQVVLSIMSMADMNDPNACATVKRRVRALALVNELALTNHDASSVDAGELFKSLAPRIAESSYGSSPAVLVRVRSSVELDPQSAGLAAIIGADILADMCDCSKGINIDLEADARHARAFIRYPYELPDSMAAQCLDRAQASPLLRSAGPEVEIAIIARDLENGPGIVLTVQAP